MDVLVTISCGAPISVQRYSLRYSEWHPNTGILE